MRNIMLQKVDNKTLKVGVVGLGYVGLPLAVEFAEAGYTTVGFDVSDDKVSKVNSCDNYIKDVDEEGLTYVVNKGLLKATDDFSQIKDVDFIAICVPSPLDRYQQPDVSYIRSSAEAIADNMTKGTAVVLESTTYPGTTDELIKPILESGSDLVCGEDFYLGFSPERVDPGNKKFKTKNTPKVVGAIGEDAQYVIKKIYENVLNADIFLTSTPAAAEMTKILENTYRNINIGLANEMSILCKKMDINYWEVVKAAATKPFGFQAFYPGPGLGGHCIPLDPYYLSWKAREYGFHTSMIEASMMVNDRMPEYCIERASKILNSSAKSLKKSKILMVGVSYKNDIDDYRESPVIEIIERLQKAEALVEYYDPYVPFFKEKKLSMSGITKLDAELVKTFDLIIITAAHTNIDYEMIVNNAQKVFDTRNATSSFVSKENVELL